MKKILHYPVAIMLACTPVTNVLANPTQDIVKDLEAATKQMEKDLAAMSNDQQQTKPASGSDLRLAFPVKITGWTRDPLDDDTIFDASKMAMAGYSRTSEGFGNLSAQISKTEPNELSRLLPKVEPKLGYSDEVRTVLTTKEDINGVKAFLWYDMATGEENGSGELTFEINGHQISVTGSAVAKRDILALGRAIDLKKLKAR